jgi:hypothetical protein
VLFFSHGWSLGPFFAEGRVIEKFYCELFEFDEDVLGPGESFEVFQRFEVFC